MAKVIRPEQLGSSISEILKKHNIDSLESSNKIVRATAINIFGAVIKDTPADTGRLRGNWFLTVGSPSNATTDKTDKSKDDSYVASKLPRKILKKRVFLTNNLPYAERIEYEGYSKIKAPAGMMRKNTARFKSVLNKISAKNSRR